MQTKHYYQSGHLAFVVIFMATILVAASLADSDSTSVGDGASELGGGTPKRQSYLIAPRIGRSLGGQPSAIWSALEEAALTVPGQVQPHRGYPGPLRSSLLFLVGNRRTIGQRSGAGLLPQARIGRRSSPVGLMPQPRVGRRSAEQASIIDTDFDGDTSNGVTREARADLDRASREAGAPIEKPTYRTTSFVPRLGKREPQPTALDRLMVDRLLCANYGLDCGRLMEELSRTGTVVADSPTGSSIHSPLSALIDGLSQEGSLRMANGEQLAKDDEMSLLAFLNQRLNPGARIQERGSSNELFDGLSVVVGPGGTKRVAFTPRIG